MIRREEIARELLDWYRLNRRDLPWRRRPTPYRVWISEVMLQQTQVETVVPYYERFLKAFPDLKRLARAREEEVVALWSGLGYYRRVQNLHAAARRIAQEHNGRFPRQLDQALGLPGVGPYTAAAVLSIAYNLPLPVIDGNVERVLSRIFLLPGDPAKTVARRRLQREASRLIPPGQASDFNQALMELGALVCLPTAPKCDQCPLRRNCRGLKSGEPSRFPRRAPRQKSVAVHLAVLVLRRGTKLLMERQTSNGEAGAAGLTQGRSYLRGVWNFPAVEVASPEDAPTFLRRYLAQTWGRKVEIKGALGTAQHAITFRKITVHVWKGRVVPRSQPTNPARRSCNGRTWRWIEPTSFGSEVAVPALATKVLTLIEADGNDRKLLKENEL